MNVSGLLLAIDQGTSATKCVLVDTTGKIVAKTASPLGETYPQPGWVEQDAELIWQSAQLAVAECLRLVPDGKIIAAGLSTQRESALIWDRQTHKPLTPLLSWQDQRTVALRDQFVTQGVADLVRDRSGLPLDPMFSALKLAWLLDRIDPDRKQSQSGQWCVGTIDTYFASRLGKRELAEVGNASRTQLLNVRSGQWDDELLRIFGIPSALLPEVVPSIADFGDAGELHPALRGVRLHAVMADSHSALFAHGAYTPGQVKATMGTGSSVMGLTSDCATVHPGLCVTIGWDRGQGHQLALEGNIRAAGSTVRWIANLFGTTTDEVAAIAAVNKSKGACLVPAFNGLGAPWWDSRALGLVSGLTLGTTKETLFAAAIESIAHQVTDVIGAMDASGAKVDRLLLDGGPSRNAHLRGLLAGFLARPVVHCSDAELSALGVAHLAGLGSDVWDIEALARLPRAQTTTEPVVGEELQAMRKQWARALAQSRLDLPTG